MWHQCLTVHRTCGYSRSSSTRTAIEGDMVAHGGYPRAMDAYLAVASRREVRRYADRPIPPEVERRILEAGRVSGSSRNKQPWRFVVLEQREAVERAAGAGWAADTVRGAALVVGRIVSGKGPVSFDAGRAAQNMMLAAWNDGVGACPNGISDPAAMGEAIGLREDDHFAVVLTFGYPAREVDAESRTPEEGIARADRRPLSEIVGRRRAAAPRRRPPRPSVQRPRLAVSTIRVAAPESYLFPTANPSRGGDAKPEVSRRQLGRRLPGSPKAVWGTLDAGVPVGALGGRRPGHRRRRAARRIRSSP